MGEVSAIAWTDATFNPWIGCSRVSAGCEHCYAEAFASKRMRLPVWGVDAQRKPTSDDYWRGPARWNAKATKTGTRMRVFCASMADVFEVAPARNVDANLVMNAARARLWDLIESTPALDWQLLTKRPQNIMRLVPPRWLERFPPNVWVGATAEGQEEYAKRWPILAEVPARVHFISHEPAMGRLLLTCHGCTHTTYAHRAPDGGGCSGWFPDWVITGGESGPGARPYDLGWARDLVRQTKGTRTALFVKQLGADPIDGLAGCSVMLRDRKGGDPSEWPEELRVQQFPHLTQRDAAAE